MGHPYENRCQECQDGQKTLPISSQARSGVVPPRWPSRSETRAAALPLGAIPKFSEFHQLSGLMDWVAWFTAMEAVNLQAIVRGMEDIPSIKVHTFLSKACSPRCLILTSRVSAALRRVIFPLLVTLETFGKNVAA